jgi:zinc protease
VDDVRAFHANHFGARNLQVVLVGDLDPHAAGDAVRRSLGDWMVATRRGSFETAATPLTPGREDVPMPDKQNLDVRIGLPLALRRDHADYLPLYVGTYVLGGNFSARLMTRVRDEQGLTYGIGARLGGIAVEHDAYFVTSVTLSRENLDRGIEATLAEISRFAEGGITDEELDEKQTTLKGIFRVGLATTGGLAQALLTNAERGFDVAYLDRFPERIEALRVESINDAVSRHIDPLRLHLAVAGTLHAPLR